MQRPLPFLQSYTQAAFWHSFWVTMQPGNRAAVDQALIIIRGKKVLQVDKMDYSKHPEAKYLRSCKASAHVPEWRRLEEEAAKTPQPTPKPAPAAKKPAKRKATKPASPTDKSPKEAPAPKSAGTPEGIITTDKDSILS